MRAPRPFRRLAFLAMRRPHRLAAALALALLAARGAGAAEAAAKTATPTLEALMAGMSKTSGVMAGFLERKRIALLSEPIETHGQLVFVPPDHLVRTTESPSRSRLVIAGERVAFHDAAGGDSVDLSANPIAREFVENFIVLFNGDLEKLKERYEPEFSASGSGWKLALAPRHRPLADVVERITLSGEGTQLTRMQMLERDGDETTTTFSNVVVDRHFSPEEIERLFALSGPE